MTTELEMHELFEKQFFAFEENRMYPLTHRSNFMIVINDRHLKAVARAIHFVQSGISPQMSARVRASVELDLILLDEIHKFCRQQIVEPGLPMSPVVPETPPEEEPDGHSS